MTDLDERERLLAIFLERFDDFKRRLDALNAEIRKRRLWWWRPLSPTQKAELNELLREKDFMTAIFRELNDTALRERIERLERRRVQ